MKAFLVGLAVLLALLSLAAAQASTFSCPANYVPSDSCTAGPCRCAKFQTVRIKTDATVTPKTTEIIVRVTNVCPNQPVFYAQFSLDSVDRSQSLTLVQPSQTVNYIGNGAYKWTVSVVDGRASASATTPAIRWVRFTATTPNPNALMVAGSTSYDYETFRFVVTGYNPVFPWYYQLHQGADWDTFGPLDLSLCSCTNCDASASVRLIESCSLRYPDQSSNLSPTIFNENDVLYSFQIEGSSLEMFYSDEHALTIGTRQVKARDGKITPYPVTKSSNTPSCVSGAALQLGLWNFNGRDQQANIDLNTAVTGCKEDPANVKPTCGRPIPPTLFVTDITANAMARDGDWQQGGKPFPPQKICGVWKSVIKNVSTAAGDIPSVFKFDLYPDGNPTSNLNSAGSGWNFGPGADPLPVGFINPATVTPKIQGFGAEVVWNLDLLNLNPANKYRFQFLVHDGDQTRVGGDVGQACIVASAACPAGFTGPTCQQCDTSPVPRDGSWTWYCFPTGSNTSANAYQLIKIPTVKLDTPLYKNSGGFKIGDNIRDGLGYFVTCDCKRIVVPCDSNCCGNGICDDTAGVCKACGNPDLLPDPATCCPTLDNRTLCFNDGNFCSGNGRCVSNKCDCFTAPDGTADWTGVSCNVSVVKKKTCAQLPATNCQSCLDAADANGIYCGWCTARTPGTQAALDNGRCSDAAGCVAPAAATYPANVTNLGACFITTTYVPEPCPDNCTSNGKCVNKTTTPTTSANNKTGNYSLVCVCYEGYTGANCAVPPAIIATVAGIAAGVIAGIVIAIVAFLALAGGGAYAAAQAMGTGGAAPVVNNPLYRGDGNQGMNPLYKA